MISTYPQKNISYYDILYAFINQFFELFDDFILYKKKFKNYFHVIKKRLTNQYPIEVTLINGKQIIVKNIFQLRIQKWWNENFCSIDNNLLIISSSHLPKVKFVGWEKNGDVGSIFFGNEYEWLPVKGKTVIDIGANIGDSSIFFALKGAKKIIAFEPSPTNYNLAVENIKINNFDSKIEIRLAGCSNKRGNILIDDEEGGILYFLEEKSRLGVKIPLIPLGDIISNIQTEHLVLKMDCEGCEYDSIMNTENDVLKKFSHIQIEYHFGYRNLKEKLVKCGFNVSVTRPRLGKKLSQKKTQSFVGQIYAYKKF